MAHVVRLACLRQQELAAAHGRLKASLLNDNDRAQVEAKALVLKLRALRPGLRPFWLFAKTARATLKCCSDTGEYRRVKQALVRLLGEEPVAFACRNRSIFWNYETVQEEAA